VSFAAITLCVASQRVFTVVVYFVMTQSGNFWIHLEQQWMLVADSSKNETTLKRALHPPPPPLIEFRSE
jgi:hypothetical protein